jgi:hypothetical protein
VDNKASFITLKVVQFFQTKILTFSVPHTNLLYSIKANHTRNFQYSSNVQLYNNMLFIVLLPIIYTVFFVHHFLLARQRSRGMPAKAVGVSYYFLLFAKHFLLVVHSNARNQRHGDNGVHRLHSNAVC